MIFYLTLLFLNHDFLPRIFNVPSPLPHLIFLPNSFNIKGERVILSYFHVIFFPTTLILPAPLPYLKFFPEDLINPPNPRTLYIPDVN